VIIIVAVGFHVFEAAKQLRLFERYKPPETHHAFFKAIHIHSLSQMSAALFASILLGFVHARSMQGKVYIEPTALSTLTKLSMALMRNSTSRQARLHDS
jgi:hypothetical protein